MARNNGSVRIGPVSLFTLIIVLCLAVLSVLAVTTAQATYAATERQAAFMVDTYANETAAQEFVAGVDAELFATREKGGTSADGVAAVERTLDTLCASVSNDNVTAEAKMTSASTSTDADATSTTSTAAGAADATGAAPGAADATSTASAADATTDSAADSAAGSTLQATFTTSSGRCLEVHLAFGSDGSYEISQWKTTTLWNDEGAGDVLWSGATTKG